MNENYIPEKWIKDVEENVKLTIVTVAGCPHSCLNPGNGYSILAEITVAGCQPSKF